VAALLPGGDVSCLPHTPIFTRPIPGAKARDYFALATSCFERLESASDPTARSDLKQLAHRSLEEAIKLLTNGPIRPVL
jgi:hypothetical protein